MATPLKVLFVDDEAHVLSGIKRTLFGQRREWEMDFVTSGEEALEALAKTRYDVVVADMRMPGMDGADLLKTIQERWPTTVRLILSGHSGQDAIYRSIGPTHQFLSKPCDPETLKAAIGRSAALDAMLANPRLQQLVGSMTDLPCLPTLYQELVGVLQTPNCSLQQVADVIAQDGAMTARILQLVNSAFFGLPNEISNPRTAVNLLGVNTITSLVLSVGVFDPADTAKIAEFGLESVWRHALETARLAKAIAAESGGDALTIDTAFTAGLLHDLGKIVLALGCTDGFRAALAAEGAKHAAERDACGASHAEIGAYLMGVWGLPNPIVEAVAFHHEPGRTVPSGVTPLLAVHVANALWHDADGSGDLAEALDAEYLAASGLPADPQHWLTVAGDLLAAAD